MKHSNFFVLGLILSYDESNVKNLEFSIWNVRSLYRGGSLTAVGRELSKYKLRLLGVQEVSWDIFGTVRAGDFVFFLRDRT
jgi:hypothetical protein